MASWNEDDVRILFEMLFDLRLLLDEVVRLLEGGDGIGEAEEDDE